jgi:beta-fructofuranosidase
VLEIEARIRPGSAARVGLALRVSPDGLEETLLEYNCLTQRLEINRDRSSLANGPLGGIHGGNLNLGADEALELHVFLDRSIVEVFANARMTLTERIYPSREDSTSVAAFAVGGRATLESMQVWYLEEASSVIES